MALREKTVLVLLMGALAVMPVLASGGGEDAMAAETKPTLRFLGPSTSTDPNDAVPARVLEEVTGYKVEYEALPTENTADKLNLLLASGEPYDVITHRARFKEEAVNFAKQGALIELDPLIKKYGPNVPKAMSDDSLGYFRVGGKTFILPGKLPVEFSRYYLAVRDDWLEAVGADRPETTVQLVKVMEAFRDRDPGGNGDANLAFTIYSPDLVKGLMGAFGVENFWNEQGRGLVPMEEHPGFRQYLTFMSDLYQRKLLDAEFPANKRKNVEEKFLSGRAGIVPWQVFGSQHLVLALPENVPGASASPLAPIAGPDGQRGSSQETGYAFVTYIPKVAENPEHAMRWINTKLEPEAFRKGTIGFEGEHHSIEDGIFKPILPKFQDEFLNGYWYLTGTIEKDYARYWLEVRLQRVTEMYQGFNAVQDLVSPFYKMDVTSLAVGLETYPRKKSELQGMTRDFMIKVIAGAEPLTEVDSFVRKWQQAGGTAAKQELNDWYRTKYK